MVVKIAWMVGIKEIKINISVSNEFIFFFLDGWIYIVQHYLSLYT